MEIKSRQTGDPITFAEFANSHEEHAHCIGCGGCLLDPNPVVQASAPFVWCVGCRDRVKAGLPEGKLPPWTWVRTKDGVEAALARGL